MAAPSSGAVAAKALRVLRDAAEAVYSGRATSAQLGASFPGVDRRRVGELVRALPPGLANSDQELSLRRAVNAALCMSQKSAYTEAEMRGALVAVLRGQLTYAAASARYGPAAKTLQHHVGVLRRSGGAHASEAEVQRAVSAHALPKPGAQPLLSSPEVAALVARAQGAATAGAGVTRRALGAQARGMAVAKAAVLQPGAARARLENAFASPSAGARLLRQAKGSGLLLAPATERKASVISQKRAAAADPKLSAQFAATVGGFYAELYAQGILTTKEPEADQVFNADEWGISPEGARRRNAWQQSTAPARRG